MNLYQLVRHFTAWIVTATLMGVGAAVWADPPSRVARLAYISGAASFSPAGENDWNQANINRPLGNGDRLWADERARVEIQTNGTTLRMDGNTSVAVVNLDDRMTQLQLTQGRLLVRVRRLAPNQVVEINTPNLAFTVRRPGEYHISVDPRGNATDIAVRSGSGDAAGEGVAYRIETRQALRFYGTGLRDYQSLAITRPDAFEAWAAGRDRQVDRSVAARYVSPDVLGYQDLDAHGSWRRDPTYGNVWVPRRVAADWTPYRDGHWSWVDPWGWTWIDDAPWGFAVSHYGRWSNMQGTWAWVPGPIRQRAYYAPAVVAFVGGNNFQVPSSSGNVGGVAWFPLAPREIYRPSYPVSRAYFENLNRSNTVVDTTVINNTYNVTNVTNVTNVVHVNQRIAGAVTAVPTTVFVQAQPVARSALRVAPEVIASAPVTALATVVPTERSVRGGAAPGNRPPGRVFERAVVASTAAPAPLAGLAAQLAQLATQPGKPLDNAARKALVSAAAVPAAVVTVVAPVKAVVPPAAPSAAVAATAASAPATAARPAAGASAAPAAPAAAASRALPPQAPVVPTPVAAASAAPVVRAPAVTPTVALPASAPTVQPAPAPVAPRAPLPTAVASPPPAAAIAPRAPASQPTTRASEPTASASRPVPTPPRLVPLPPGPATPVAPASAPTQARAVPAAAASVAELQRPKPAASATDRPNRPEPGASNPRGSEGARERRKPAGDTP